MNDGPPLAPKRDGSVDTLRGVACILLVQFHTIEALYIDLKHAEIFWRNFSDFFYYLRMPLFTFLSGMIYARRPFTSNFTSYIKGKGRRILLPMVTVGTLYALSGIIFAGKSYSLTQLVYLKPVDYLWYLESLFTIFIIIALLEKKKILSKPLPFAAIFAASIVIYTIFFDNNIQWFALFGTLYLLPPFLAGMAYTRFFKQTVDNMQKLPIYTLLVLSLSLLGLLSWKTEPGEFPSLLLYSCLLCFAVIAVKFNNALLSKLGLYSYSVYLFHVFFISFAKSFLEAADMTEPTIYVATGTIVGLLGPIVLHKILSLHSLPAMFFLGARPAKKKKAEAPSIDLREDLRQGVATDKS